MAKKPNHNVEDACFARETETKKKRKDHTSLKAMVNTIERIMRTTKGEKQTHSERGHDDAVSGGSRSQEDFARERSRRLGRKTRAKKKAKTTTINTINHKTMAKRTKVAKNMKKAKANAPWRRRR